METALKTSPREKQVRWAVAILGLFFVGLAADYFFLHLVFQEKMKDQQKIEAPLAPQQ